MAGIPLASAFVRIRPDTDRREFERSGREAGQAAGKTYADGFYRDAQGKLRQANGRFATDAQKRMVEGGGASGRGFGDAFTKEGGGTIRRGFSKLRGELGPLLIPLGIGGAVAAIGKIGIEYENNLNILQSVTRATGEQMQDVAKKARELGADVQLPGVSAAGAAKAMTELSKAGFTVQQSMDAARGTLQLARIAQISEGQAATISANAVNAFGIEARETGFVVDELAAAANSSSVEIADVSLSFKMAAAVFSGFQGPVVGSKESITELNTAIAILGNQGIRGSDAGTSLKQMLLQLTGPTMQAKDQMKLLAQRASGANVSLEQQDAILHGSKAVREAAIAEVNKLNPALADTGDIAFDASGKMRPLRDIIDLVTRGTKGMTQEEKLYAITQIFGADASRSVLALMKGGLPVYDKQRQAIMQQGSAARVAAAQNAGLGGAIDNVKGQLENAAIAIYNQIKGPLTTALRGLAEVLSPLAGGIERFGNFVRENGATIRDWAVAIGAVTLALKVNSAMLAITAAGGFLNWIKGITLITRTTQAWAGAQALLNATLIANPIGAVIVALVALGAGLVLLFRHNETFRKIVMAVWGAIKTAVAATVDWIVNTAWPALKAAWDGIAAAAMWLWRNVIEPVWNGIKTVIGVVISVVKGYIGLLVAEFKVIAAVALWLWRNIFSPVFAGIGKVVEVFWFAARIIFQALYNIFRNVLGQAIQGWKIVFSAAFAFVRDRVIAPWWSFVKGVFGLFRAYILGPIVNVINFFRAVAVRVFSLVAAAVSTWWRNNVSPVLTAVRRAWDQLAGTFVSIYQNKIKPLFDRFVGFIKGTVVSGFKTGVDAIASAWDKVKEAAKKPVAFVVNNVINPFIGGLNKAAGIVGIKDRIEPIAGFADGGQVLSRATGGRIAGMASARDNRLAPATIPGVGAVKLAGGEFVVNARDTARALPLLRWINDGMRSGGPRGASARIGRTMAREPGDGSEGWAFAEGGLVGFVKDVWGAISDPVKRIKRPFEALLDRVPGAGRIKDFLIGSARKLLGGALSWLTGGTGTSAGGNVGAAQAFVRAQAGKPYVWASAGPGGYDCSGIVSAAYNILKGRKPHSHTFSTGSLPGPWFDTRRKIGGLVAGWSHPGQRPASARVGHMAGMIGGLPFESTGSRGVRVGGAARRVTEFANIGAARAKGGLLGEPIRVFDSGGYWPSGTLGANLSGRTEFVDANRDGQAGRGDTFHFHEGAFAGAIMASSSQAEDLVVTAIKSAKRKRRIP